MEISASVAQSAARQSHNETLQKRNLKVVSSSLTRGNFLHAILENSSLKNIQKILPRAGFEPAT